MPAKMGHVALMSHETLRRKDISMSILRTAHLAAVIASKWEVPCVPALVAHQLIPITELFLAEVTRVALCILVNPCVLGEVLSLGKAFAADLTNKCLAY